MAAQIQGREMLTQIVVTEAVTSRRDHVLNRSFWYIIQVLLMWFFNGKREKEKFRMSPDFWPEHLEEWTKPLLR